jgi:AcrR family transcriptional regulator
MTSVAAGRPIEDRQSDSVAAMSEGGERAGAARGSYAKTAQRRVEIVEAALQVFSESGFRDGSLRDIAQRAGMTHAGMRHHFPTKVALLEAVLRWRDDESLAFAAGARSRGLGALHEWVEATRRNALRPSIIELEVTLSAEAVAPDHPAHRYFAEHYGAAEQVLVRAFSAIDAEGHLAERASVQSAARTVLGATLGLQQLWLWDRDRDLVGELSEVIQSLLAVPFAASNAHS